MPNLDGTGPTGKGPKTGGQMGKCSDVKPQEKPLDGRGEGKGMGRGKGRGRSQRGLGKGLGQRSNNS